MAERKLNFNAPLMSVRRFAMTSNREKKKIVESSPAKRKHTRERDLAFEPAFSLEQVTEPVAVPFHWEQIPGRPKDDNEPEPWPQKEAAVTPRIPPGKVLESRKQQQVDVDYNTNKADLRPQMKTFSFNSSVVESKYSKEGKNDRRGFELEDENDADDVYSDALDTLSSKESTSNCSASGLSGSEGVGLAKPSGTFSTDPQTRDFMMKRFLPAAKAMALEPARYATKKQAVAVEEPPREVKRMNIGKEKRPSSQGERRPNLVVPQYGDYQEEEEEESEEEVNEYDNPANISARGCGFFPRLCYRNSLSLLNPVPGLKIRTGTPRKTAYNQSQSKNVKKAQAWDSTYKPTYKPKTDCGFRSGELQVVENKWVNESRRLTYSGDLQRARSSPFRNPRVVSISPYRNQSTQSPFRRAAFLGIPKEENARAAINNRANLYNNKGSNKFQEISSHHWNNKPGSFSMSPAIEKTLYVDTVNNADHKTSYSNSNSGFLDSKVQANYAGGEDFEHYLLEPRREEEEISVESIFQDIKCLSKRSSSLGDSEIGLVHAVKSLEYSEMAATAAKGNLDNDSDRIPNDNDDNLGNENGSLVQSPLPPPLPKSPSESWLWRTIPSVSLRNSFSNVSIGAKTQAKLMESKTSSTSSKWETIVKCSHLHHDHARYSEELIAHISQQSKT